MPVLTLRASRLSVDGDGIALFEHLHGEARNPLSMDLRADYAEMLDHVEADPAVRALVIAGSGGSFCAGGDVKDMRERLEHGQQTAPAAARRRILDLHRWLQRLRDLELPVIAAVDGAAWGGGFAIALCADFVLATPRASFCMAFLRIGALPDMGAIHLLPRAIGLPRAKDLLMTGRRVDAREAIQLGLVHSLHEPEALQREALALSRRFLAAPRVALGLTKRMANRAYELDAATMSELEACAQATCLAEPDHAEAVRRFVRKEPFRFDWDRDATDSAKAAQTTTWTQR
ncbi:4-chlorobenzoyl coenzyme A dehalogenase-2 [Variovorax sp. SRS16]|uniref:enoyl-CoA hydratase/isomerase family protein n=1 Tax=Variovorax sp. SRS16 TaxID=282217 RepID=UPI0013172BA4|nr:enoyl-CoA hydratase/isomerase family protein [Variovorax sp. SRS16]VTU21585.1 4-chlorobenzoyl coenzyme A dehalogenase-2 [Variovorax sp. SRS16]